VKVESEKEKMERLDREAGTMQRLRRRSRNVAVRDFLFKEEEKEKEELRQRKKAKEEND
jgi:hypothetical protein